MGLLRFLGLTPLPSMLASVGDAAIPPPPAGSAEPARAGGKARPSDALDVQLGTALGALTAVLDGIHDDAAAAPLRASLQKVIDGRVAAEAMADGKRVVALKALLASVARQKPLADAALKKATAIEKRESARKEIDVRLGQVTALVLGGIDHDAMRNAINAGLEKAKANYAKADKLTDMAKGEKAFQAMKPEALALLVRAEKAKSVSDSIAASKLPLDVELKRLAGVIAAMGKDGTGPLAERLAELTAIKAKSWPEGATTEAIEKAIADFAASVTALSTAIAAMKQLFDDKAAYEKAYAAIKSEVEQAVLYHTNSGGALTSAVAVGFSNAKSAVDAAVGLPDWAAAKAALPALKTAAAAVLKARNDKQAFDLAHAALAADRASVQAAFGGAGLPGAVAGPYRTAFSAVTKEISARNWTAALAAVPALKKAIDDVLKAIKDGAKFYAVYASIRPDDIAAEQAARGSYEEQQSNSMLAAAGAQFWRIHHKVQAAVGRAAWGEAKDMLADLQVACRDMFNEAAQHAAARAPYDAQFNALTRRGEAETASESKAPPFATTAAAYKKQRQATYAVEATGDFVKAMATLPALQAAIDALMAVKDAQDSAKKQYQTDFAALADYAEAVQVAAGQVPALTDAAKAFQGADKAMTDARKGPDWVAALAALPPLQAAATRLVAGKNAFNGAAKPADTAAFDAKLEALEPRTAKASEAGVPTFVETLQRTVRDRLADATRQAAAKDLAAAEASYARLLTELDAMEAGKTRYAAHKARFEAMKNGAIATALAVPLAPPALAAERTAAVAKTEAQIVALAAKDDLAGADARLAFWASEAKGWQETQKAYAELHSGKVPKTSELEALAAKPGGEQALDELIMNLPPTTPAKVLGACLKARFGFEVKRIEEMNANVQDLGGTKAKDPEHADPELVAMYKLMSQIPSGRIKGKITELVDFDTNDGGGVYYGGSEKKIYTHAGRLNAGKEKEFGQEGEVMPKGQEVEEDCKPAPAAPKMPVSNHTLLHEAAHAEDDGIKFMDGKWGAPEFGGWEKESPASIAKIAAPHLRFDETWIRETLEDKSCKPPQKTPKPRKGVSADEWEKRRQAALVWCETIRAANGIWWKGAICQRVAIGGRVYQESYDDGRWRSYLYAARAKGISGYQFRAPAEWFAELYAAYFGEKLKPSHPAMSWLVKFKPKEQ